MSTETRPQMHARKRSSICIGRPNDLRRPGSIRIPSSGSESSIPSTTIRSAGAVAPGNLMPLHLEAVADVRKPVPKHRRALSLAPSATASHDVLPFQLAALQTCAEQAEPSVVQTQPSRRTRPTSVFFSRFTTAAQEAVAAPLPPTEDRAIKALRNQVEDLSTQVLAKDLTISMLTERVDDLTMEMALMRSKMRLLEHAAKAQANVALTTDALLLDAVEEEVAELDLDKAEEYCWQNRAKRPKALSVRSISTSGDSGFAGSVRHTENGQSPTRQVQHEIVSPALSRQSSASAYSTPNSVRRGVEHADGGDLSMDGLQQENEALRREVGRLSAALEDGLGALAELAI